MNFSQKVYLNIESIKQNSYDAIVVGTGITGGWAAKELCEKGLKTLVLERGRNIEHVKDYHTSGLMPWQFPHRLENSLKDKEDIPIQSFACNESNRHFYVSDKEHPYIQVRPFNWLRGYQVGGRSLTWGRQCYRMSDLDFEANAKDGFGVDWPIRYKDVAYWYDYVENFIGISGKAEGLPHLPDGKFLPAMEMNFIENYFSKQIRSNYNDRIVTIGRVANLTKGWQGRGPCQYRNLCDRGCPNGGYFSSNSATLPAAAITGNMTLIPDCIVTEVIYSKDKNRAVGVRVINAHTKEITEYYATIIFLNASSIASAAILLNSTSSRFPNGLGNSSDQVGRNLMDHFTGTGAEADFEAISSKPEVGLKPVGIYVPRFRNISKETFQRDYIRGFGLQGIGGGQDWITKAMEVRGFGKEFKRQLLEPGPWKLWLGGWGETLPYFDNRITLDENKKDQWGFPLIKISYKYRSNEKVMRKDILESMEEMLTVSGFKNINSYSAMHPGGSAIHEMGVARMGKDPKTSVLNGYNQMHDIKNVFITDGSCMTSSATQNPSLTYMALTARACDYAVNELKRRNI